MKAATFGSGDGYRTRAEGECIIGGMNEFDDGGADALTEATGEAEQRAIDRIAGRVIAERARPDQIREPR